MGFRESLRILAGLLDKLINARWTAEVIGLAGDNPRTVIAGPGFCNRAEAITGLRVQVVVRLEFCVLDGGRF